ncbi:hypothetical protein PILCRDRAFT_14333 [Piloderma croceum F 1598]|uniref:Uncharacterized protein n=1 Tax=Piloderma croceum (strain F 1598) TaxID=765440 RepID=A0A0C3F3C9_PILCF|nr:hypothetical protein PILCRDRAFT_14333 [Piloderma croceum F 1598]
MAGMVLFSPVTETLLSSGIRMIVFHELERVEDEDQTAGQEKQQVQVHYDEEDKEAEINQPLPFNHRSWSSPVKLTPIVYNLIFDCLPYITRLLARSQQ